MISSSLKLGSWNDFSKVSYLCDASPLELCIWLMRVCPFWIWILLLIFILDQMSNKKSFTAIKFSIIFWFCSSLSFFMVSTLMLLLGLDQILNKFKYLMKNKQSLNHSRFDGQIFNWLYHFSSLLNKKIRDF